MNGPRMTAQARREQLLDVCRDIVAADGFAEATIDRVARDAGVTRTLIYRQFGDLTGLLAAFVERETAIGMAGLLDVAGKVPQTSDGNGLLAAMLDATDADPVTWRILLNPPAGGPPELATFIAEGLSLARDLVRQAFADELAVAEDPELTAHLIHQLGNELVRLHVNDPDAYPRERVQAIHRQLIPL